MIDRFPPKGACPKGTRAQRDRELRSRITALAIHQTLCAEALVRNVDSSPPRRKLSGAGYFPGAIDDDEIKASGSARCGNDNLKCHTRLGDLVALVVYLPPGSSSIHTGA